jgi:hypothetical protein
MESQQVESVKEPTITEMAQKSVKDEETYS